MKRYSARGNGLSAWKVFDSVRGCSIVSSISINAKYNKEVATQIVDALNAQEVDWEEKRKQFNKEVLHNKDHTVWHIDAIFKWFES